MIGIDIVSIARVEAFVAKFGDKALDRFLDKEEQKLAQKIETIAGFWAAKEAISKALGTGIGAELAFGDIKLYKDAKNRPSFQILNQTFTQTSLSISHDGGFAIAVAIIIA